MSKIAYNSVTMSQKPSFEIHWGDRASAEVKTLALHSGSILGTSPGVDSDQCANAQVLQCWELSRATSAVLRTSYGAGT